jgi:excisionase family DNA binding protein
MVDLETVHTLTVDEVAAVLRINRTHAYRMVKSGVIPSIRLGRRVVVPRASIEEMLKSAPAPGKE